MTIAEAAQTVLNNAGKALTVDEIYDEIVKQNLYTFGAKQPKSVLSQTLRKNSKLSPNAKKILFKSNAKGTYALAD